MDCAHLVLQLDKLAAYGLGDEVRPGSEELASLQYAVTSTFSSSFCSGRSAKAAGAWLACLQVEAFQVNAEAVQLQPSPGMVRYP